MGPILASNFFTVIQIQSKFNFAEIPLMPVRSLQNVAHVMTEQLLCNVQSIVLIFLMIMMKTNWNAHEI